MKGLGKKLKYFRENCELSQQQVATALNVDRSTYTYYETGKTTPSASTLLKLSKIFNVPCAVFLESINQELKLNSRVSDVEGGYLSEYADINKEVVTVDDRIYGLSKEEKEIIACYRVLDEDQLVELNAFMKELLNRKKK